MELKMLKFCLLAVVFCCAQHFVEGTRYCVEDGDCSDLGDLICRKSMCRWGVCGCRRGYAARFLGTLRKFKCVKMKRVGDFCSHDLDIGVCAANNSYCDGGVCKCIEGYVSRFHGEVCLPEWHGYASESSTDSMGGQCVTAFHAPDLVSNTAHLYRQSAVLDPFASLVPRCHCPPGYGTVLSNDYSDSGFFSAKVPICQMRQIDNERDKCVTREECPQVGGSGVDCDDFFVCRCSQRGHVRNFEANKCGKPLRFGDVCTKARKPLLEYVCDGRLGLICGSPCELKRPSEADEDTCHCAPSYIAQLTRNGTTICIENQEGSPCYGDFNCKSPSLGQMATCSLSGTCQRDSALSHYEKHSVLPIATAFCLLFLHFGQIFV